MYIILGATGHIGSVVAESLIKQNKKVTVVLHNADKEKEWQQKGATTAVVDVNDSDALAKIFNTGTSAFILNPPAPISSDMVATEKKSVASILKAIQNSNLEKVVAESTYGAQPGDGIGDLGVLYELEQGLSALSISTTIIRGAYYMSNWDAALQTAIKEGIVHTLYPPDFKLPMVAPSDIGELAAQLLLQSNNKDLYNAEGPKEYSSSDVATAFSKALNKEVIAIQTPPEKWNEALHQLGFSKPAAQSMIAMTKLTLENAARPSNSYKGKTTLQQYISALVNNTKSV